MFVFMTQHYIQLCFSSQFLLYLEAFSGVHDHGHLFYSFTFRAQHFS